ncbi:MAG: glycosyltransferase family 2 protein [Candidatus Omnitrophica bacterium]|nr:glycosyltransferase family 2 protein [Candidatus Omnitrophota bacterium]
MEEKNKNPLCSVLVLNYNGKEHLDKCFSSLVKQTYLDYELILVDNASVDSSVDLVRQKFPQVKIVRSEANLGTAGGFNFGAKYAKGDYMLFLANDMEAREDLLEKLLQTVHDDVQIATGKMLDYWDRGLVDYAGIKMDVFGFPTIIGHRKKDSEKYNKIVETIPTGTVLLIKRSIFERAGGFDSDNFTLGDELDLWWRVRLLGYKCLYNPEAIVYHKGGATLKQFKRANLRFLSEKNTIRNLIKNYSLPYLMPILSAYAIFIFAEAIFYFLIGKTDFAISILKAAKWNIKKLPHTLELRRAVQANRKVSDIILLRSFYKGSYKLHMFLEWVRGDLKGFTEDKK